VDQRIIHGDRAISVTGDRGRREPRDRRADDDRDILDEMVLEIAACFDFEIQGRIAGERTSM
jgi:hypothetical protein